MESVVPGSVERGAGDRRLIRVPFLGLGVVDDPLRDPDRGMSRESGDRHRLPSDHARGLMGDRAFDQAVFLRAEPDEGALFG